MSKGIRLSPMIFCVVVTATVGLVLAAPIEAAVRPFGCGAAMAFYSTQSQQPHPKTARIEITLSELPDAALALEPGFDFCLYYDAAPGMAPEGWIAGRVLVYRGEEKQAKVRLRRARLEGGHSRTCATAAVALEVGDTVIWKVRYSKMADLDYFQTYSIEGALFPGGVVDP